MSYYSEFQGYKQPSKEELMNKSRIILEQASRKGIVYNPVILNGRNLVYNWWGKSWCLHLKSFSDYFIRLERGRRYASSNTIIDLNVSQGFIQGLVIGTRSRPYSVTIDVNLLDNDKIDKIAHTCSSCLSNIDELIKGNFPNELQEIITNKKNGLFPSFSDMNFNCSCPDTADLCKHCAAVLYGVASRFDSNPLLLFELRGIDINKLFKNAIDYHVYKLLENNTKNSKRVLNDVNIKNIFGI